MSHDKRPSIKELLASAQYAKAGDRDHAAEVIDAAPVILEIAAAAMAYHKARNTAAAVRHRLAASNFESSLSSLSEEHDREEIRCRDAFEAALAKVQE